MKPWHSMQANMEIYLEKILGLKQVDKDIEDVGVCVVVYISICKDIGNMHDAGKQQEMWDAVKDDFDDILIDLPLFMKEKGYY